MGIDATPLIGGETAVVPVEARLTALRAVLERLFDELELLSFHNDRLNPGEREAHVDRALQLAAAALDLTPPI
jgi:hypothetical protein